MRRKHHLDIRAAALDFAHALPPLDDVGEAGGRRQVIVDLGNRLQVVEQENRIADAVIGAVFGVDLNGLMSGGMTRRRVDADARNDLGFAVNQLELDADKRSLDAEVLVLIGLVVQGDGFMANSYSLR